MHFYNFLFILEYLKIEYLCITHSQLLLELGYPKLHCIDCLC